MADDQRGKLNMNAFPKLLTGLLAVQILSTQLPTADADPEIAFGRAALKHRSELKMLWELRGAPPQTFPSAGAALGETAAALRRFPDSTLIFFDHDETNLRVWLPDRDGVVDYHVSQASATAVEHAVGQIRLAVAMPSLRSRGLLGRNSVREIPSADLAASWDLLMPDRILRRLATSSIVIVVPALGIGMVPFAAAPVNGQSLIDRAAVVVAPSLLEFVQQTLHGREQRKGPAAVNFDRPLIVGNPSPAPGFPPLPGAAREVRMVARLTRSEPLVADGATKREVISRLPGAGFLYFATHGVADAERPLDNGYLKLADGTLTAREVQSLSLTADLAVLSACEIGVGQAVPAGTIGLARAFQIAGVRNVVMSLSRGSMMNRLRSLCSIFLRRCRTSPTRVPPWPCVLRRCA